MLLIDGRQAQAPFIVSEMLANGDELVAKLSARLEAALPKTLSVAELAREFCMSERTLSRHIHRVTGKSTLALVQSIRLRRARTLLETRRMTVEQVSAAVGYQDATALRRLMKKVTRRIRAASGPRWRRKPALEGTTRRHVLMPVLKRDFCGTRSLFSFRHEPEAWWFLGVESGRDGMPKVEGRKQCRASLIELLSGLIITHGQ